MVTAQRVICSSAALLERGTGVRFTLHRRGHDCAAFAVRYNGKVYAYLNECAHVPIELDYIDGEFFDHSGLYLICSTHGATYEPNTGFCAMGPCRGERLAALRVTEHDGHVYLMENEDGHG